MAGCTMMFIEPGEPRFLAAASALSARAGDLQTTLASGTQQSTPHQRHALADVASAHANLEGQRTARSTIFVP